MILRASANLILMSSIEGADLNRDGVVGAEDISVVLSNFGRCQDECLADLNRDGWVNGADIAGVLNHFGWRYVLHEKTWWILAPGWVEAPSPFNWGPSTIWRRYHATELDVPLNIVHESLIMRFDERTEP